LLQGQIDSRSGFLLDQTFGDVVSDPNYFEDPWLFWRQGVAVVIGAGQNLGGNDLVVANFNRAANRIFSTPEFPR